MNKALAMLLIVACSAPVAFVGCDRTVAETTKEKTDTNGNVSKETKKVTEDPNGNVTVTKEKQTDTR